MKINTPSGRIFQSYPKPVKYISLSVYHASLSKYLEGGVQIKTTSSNVIYVTISVHLRVNIRNINVTTGHDSIYMYMYINKVFH